ncbi:MAG: DUF6454 family protein [Rhodothermales bacterium]
MESTYGRLILLALGLSWIGDGALLFDRRRAFFLAGLGAFLVAHLCFIAALRLYGQDTVVFLWTYALLGFPTHALIWLGWLGPHVPAGMRIPVQLYLLTILVMVSAALAVSWMHGAPVFAVAAVFFAVSDIAVARQQFVEPSTENKLWGIPLYFAAQMLFASTVGQAGRPATPAGAGLLDGLGAGTAWTLDAQQPLSFDAGHPQGFARADGALFLSTVRVTQRPARLDPPADGFDRTPGEGSGWIYRLSPGGAPIDSVRVGEGTVYHPGGIDYDGRHLWVPVAEYRPASSSIVYRVDPVTLRPEEVFRYPDHLGGVVVDTESDTLYAVSWGSRRIYAWPIENGRIDAGAGVGRTHHGHYIDYQDCQFAGAGTALCGGVNTLAGPSGPVKLGGIEHVDLRTGRPLHTVPLALYTASGTPATQNPVQIDADGGGVQLIALPEDGQGTIYVYRARGGDR